MVFAGPEGVGKTSLSRAIARAAGLHWIKVSARHWAAAKDNERWQESGERPASLQAIEADFDAARGLAPAVMFVEDLGCLSGELAAHLGRFVAESDDLNPVIVIGSALDDQRPPGQDLEAAGFEHSVYLPLPNSTHLTKALRARLEHLPHDLTDAQVGQVGRLALGGTASDLDRHLRKAQQIARRTHCGKLSFDDLAAAILDTPAASARPTISESDLVTTAYHEAGHAVLHFLESDGAALLQYVTIVPRRMDGGTALGFVLRNFDEERFSMSRAEGLVQLRSWLGGRAAEELLLGRDHVTTGAGGSPSSDLGVATALARYLIGRCGLGDQGSLVYRPATSSDVSLDRQVDALLRKQYRATLKLLRQHWPLVKALADRLLTEQELCGDEVRATLARAAGDAGPATPSSPRPQAVGPSATPTESRPRGQRRRRASRPTACRVGEASVTGRLPGSHLAGQALKARPAGPKVSLPPRRRPPPSMHSRVPCRPG